jgi:hypothetical protein
MRSFRSLSLLALLFIVLSCGKPLPELKVIDLKAWKADRNGCASKRSEMIDAIRKEKAKLLALDEMQIVTLLGKPDRNELFKRNQKFFYYFLEPSAQCETHGDNPLRLSIRFNAMGLAKEAVVE